MIILLFPYAHIANHAVRCVAFSYPLHLVHYLVEVFRWHIASAKSIDKAVNYWPFGKMIECTGDFGGHRAAHRVQGISAVHNCEIPDLAKMFLNLLIGERPEYPQSEQTNPYAFLVSKLVNDLFACPGGGTKHNNSILCIVKSVRLNENRQFHAEKLGKFAVGVVNVFL